MMHLYHSTAAGCSELITRRYSTSFSGAIRLLHHSVRQPVYGIYGFVRLADEIVDTFHDFDKESLLARFSADVWHAVEEGISLNPLLHSFQLVVRQYRIPRPLIAAFLRSMALDLHKKDYRDAAELDEYIYGSAEVVGLMCLCVFCNGDTALYGTLKEPARRLGAAFQKINFLRDIHADYKNLERTYFPGFDYAHFDARAKQEIEAGIAEDFAAALPGVLALPATARFGVYTAYRYYLTLFKKIRKMQPRRMLEQRVRVANAHKAFIVLRSRMKFGLGV